MFYKHLHDPSCDLFTHGEEAPQSKEAQLQAALDAERAENECKDTLIETLQAQLRQVEHDAETYRKMHTVCTMNLALANNELTTLRQLVSALPVVDVQEVSVWLSPDESGWLVSKRPAFPAGLYWAKFRTQAEADSFRALLAYRATLAQDAGKGDKEGEQMEHEELVRRIAKSGQEIKDSLSAKDLDLWHHATGCATEAGELLDAAKKVAIYNKPVDRENVIEELGDLEFYMQGIRANLGITREECLAHNIAKLTKRYPKGTFDNVDAVARADKHDEQDH
jgi:NTP pyrophosphatase (non-canonical NTP hydrolase)